MGVLVPVVLGLVLLVAVEAFRSRCRRAVAEAGVRCRRGARSRARQVLDERYASGEISTEDYLERVRTLGEWM